MTGQMIYTKNTRSWEHIPLNKMTTLSCQRGNTVQSRDSGWYIAWAGEFVNTGTLEEMILWVEKTA